MIIRISLLLYICIFVLASCSGFDNHQANKLTSGIDFSSSWNNHCSEYNFDQNTDVLNSTTLGDMYLGIDFVIDISLMDIAISQDIGFASGLHDASIYELYGWFDDIGDVSE